MQQPIPNPETTARSGATTKDISGSSWQHFLTIGVIAVMLVLVMLYSLHTGGEIAAVHAPLVAAVKQIKIEITLAHLWLEEFLSGDRQGEVATVWDHFDSALWYAEAMHNGNHVSGREIRPLTDVRVRQSVEQLALDIKRYRQAAEQRVSAGGNAGIGSPMEQQFDEAFERLLNQATQVEDVLQQMMARDLRRFRITQWGLIAVNIMLAVVVSVVLRRFWQRRLRDRYRLTQQERELLESQERLTRFMDTVVDSFHLVNQQLQIVEINRPAVNALIEAGIGIRDKRDVVGKPLREVYPFLDDLGVIAALEEVLRSDTSFSREEVMPHPTRGDMYISIRAFNVGDGLGIIASDITERKVAEENRLALERQVQQAQKLESLGVLAGGIAHDFNNLLMGILGNAELALAELSPHAPARRSVTAIEKATIRAADLARQMLAYSGKGKFLIEPIDLNELVEEMAHLLTISISKSALLKYDYAELLPAVEGDATQIRQIIMNLITNASEAIGEEGGVITVTTGTMECDREYLSSTQLVAQAGLDEELEEGIYAYIDIADTGCGMTAEVQAKIFDPFFTTKFTGRGLGMAAVLGIVRGHRGAITISSERGKGTTFRVLFPVSSGVAEQDEVDEPAVDESSWQARGTVLLADDEEVVLDVCARMLEQLGFTVLTARDGREAVAVFNQHMAEIDLVLLDLTMPHLDGEQAFREMRQRKNDVRVILCSGYNQQEATQRFSGKGLAGFLQKPYRLAALVEVLQKVLAQGNQEDSARGS